jgi:arginine/serine-rich splicing factor 4/5/6
MAAIRVFVGKLSDKTSEQDLNEIFGKYGTVKKIDLKVGHAFIFYDDPQDALEAVKNMDGQEVDGSIIMVESARSAREMRIKPIKRLDLRLTVLNIDGRVSWQDLKDWAREAGDVTFTNVYSRDNQPIGVVEFQVIIVKLKNEINKFI